MQIHIKKIIVLTLALATIVSATTITGTLNLVKYNDRGHYDPILGVVTDDGEFLVINDSQNGSDLVLVKSYLENKSIVIEGAVSRNKRNVTIEQYIITNVSELNIAHWKYALELDDGE